eukprot:9915562-Lingulodinium_polyedra.AAC.1
MARLPGTTLRACDVVRPRSSRGGRRQGPCTQKLVRPKEGPCERHAADVAAGRGSPAVAMQPTE